MRFASISPNRHRRRLALLPRVWVATLAAVALAVAATSGAATKVTPGTFVWHDLVTDNPAAAKKFYGELFGWTFEPGKGVEPDYTIIRHQGVPIGGIVAPKQSTSPQWLSYVVVADVDRAVEAFRQAGGQVYRAPLNVRNDLRVAAVADPQGAPLGLASRGPLEGASDAVPEIHRWLWMDYVARDEAPALQFYSQVLGYTSQSETRETATYYRLANGRPRAGLFKTPWPRETSIWLPYIRVADPEASSKRAQELGGLIVQAPAPRVRNGSLAIVLDPGGAPIALQKYPFDAGVTR
jgi:predicted enzyme related to lactoylglutathione lyase